MSEPAGACPAECPCCGVCVDCGGSGICPECDGTGEAHAESPGCWWCAGMGTCDCAIGRAITQAAVDAAERGPIT